MKFSAFERSHYNMYMLAMAMQYYRGICFLHSVQLNGFKSHMRTSTNHNRFDYELIKAGLECNNV